MKRTARRVTISFGVEADERMENAEIEKRIIKEWSLDYELKGRFSWAGPGYKVKYTEELPRVTVRRS